MTTFLPHLVDLIGPIFTFFFIMAQRRRTLTKFLFEWDERISDPIFSHIVDWEYRSQIVRTFHAYQLVRTKLKERFQRGEVKQVRFRCIDCEACKGWKTCTNFSF